MLGLSEELAMRIQAPALAVVLLVFVFSGVSACSEKTLFLGDDSGSGDARTDGKGEALPDRAGHRDGVVDQDPLPDRSQKDASRPCALGFTTLSSGTQKDLYAVWGTAENNVYVVGDGGALRYDGTAFTAKSVAAGKSDLKLRAIWGSVAAGIFIAGSYLDSSSMRKGIVVRLQASGDTLQEFGQGKSLDIHAMQGWSASSVVAMASEDAGSNTITVKELRFDGAWTSSTIVSTPFAGSVNSLWGLSSSDLYVAGGLCTSGTCTELLYRFDGSTWTQKTLPGTPPAGRLISLWGSSASNLFAVGLYSSGGSTPVNWGTASRYDGTSWTTTYLGKDFSLDGVWGDGQGTVYAVGGKGTIARNSGSGWQLMTSPVSTKLLAVAGAGSKNIFVVGEKGVVLHYCPN